MSNLKAIMQAGLQKDYNGVFNLNTDTISDALNVDVVIDGDHYVESGKPNYLHGGASNYEKHEGILPIDSTESDWKHYGKKLSAKLNNYMPSLVNTYEDGELWEGRYNQYTNQFYLKFDLNKEQQEVSYSYLSYLNTLVENKSKKVITYNLGELMTNGLDITTYIIHFSKYYNIYSTISGALMILKPLIYYDTDLSKYNLAIKEQTVNNKQQGIPYIDTLITSRWYRNKPGNRRHENSYQVSHNFDSSTDTYKRANVLVDDFSRSGGGDDWSQFHTNPQGRPVFELWNTENWNKLPQGFSTWIMRGKYFDTLSINQQYYFNKKNTGGMNDTDTLPFMYRMIFNAGTPKLLRDSKTGGLYDGKSESDYFLMGIMFRHDKNNNWHIFNTYFPVKSENMMPTQEIRYNKAGIYYKNGTGPYPKYVGLIVASILANIYVYSDEVSGTSKYVSDIVFLEDHSTIYTKDMVYRIYKKPESEKTDNELLLFHKRDFNTYLESLKKFKKDYEDTDNKFNDNNVTLHLDECIKNVPIQFKLNYAKPELSVIGEKPTVKILKITGEEIDCITDIVKPNRLYLVEDNNVKYLGKDFKIKWLKYLNRVEDKLLGEWDDTLNDVYNPYIYKMFNYNEGRLDFETTKLTINKNGQCYSIVSYWGSYGNMLCDLLTNDILVPTARVV